MGFPVAKNAICQCSFGAAPCPLVTSSQTSTTSMSQQLATIMDTNLSTFGTCISTLNPAVNSVLASTGVLVPQPCKPVIIGTWLPGSPTVLIEGKPALNNSSKLMCAYGVISIVTPLVTTVNVP